MLEAMFKSAEPNVDEAKELFAALKERVLKDTRVFRGPFLGELELEKYALAGIYTYNVISFIF